MRSGFRPRIKVEEVRHSIVSNVGVYQISGPMSEQQIPLIKNAINGLLPIIEMKTTVKGRKTTITVKVNTEGHHARKGMLRSDMILTRIYDQVEGLK